jgi:proton-coupled amino acid transporter
MTLMLDFANVLKAFIGTNFLSLPYAYAQAGITVISHFDSGPLLTSQGGTVGLVIVAIITQYCCQLLVQCKRSLQQRGRVLKYPDLDINF